MRANGQAGRRCLCMLGSRARACGRACSQAALLGLAAGLERAAGYTSHRRALSAEKTRTAVQVLRLALPVGGSSVSNATHPPSGMRSTSRSYRTCGFFLRGAREGRQVPITRSPRRTGLREQRHSAQASCSAAMLQRQCFCVQEARCSDAVHGQHMAHATAAGDHSRSHAPPRAARLSALAAHLNQAAKMVSTWPLFRPAHAWQQGAQPR